MRRQVGADRVDFDTDAGFAGYELFHPARIAFAPMGDVAYDAGYTLTGILLEIEGEITHSPCEACGGPVAFLTIPKTGQVFELEGDAPDGPLHLRARVRDWQGPHARLIGE